jgi:hypothetical protein
MDRMPRWLFDGSMAILVANPVVFVLAWLSSNLWLIYASIGLAVLALPAIVVVIIRAVAWARQD